MSFRKTSGPLASDATDALATKVSRLRKEADLGRESRFQSEMDAHAAEIKRTYGGWDKLVLRKDKDFEAARDRTVASFNEYVDKARALLVSGAMYEVLVTLGRAADALRGTYRNIEASAGRLAAELEEKARRFEYDGGAGGVSEANDYLLDVEVLQHPSSRHRFWGWYYADQVASRPESGDQSQVLSAVREALRPKFDERGRPLQRSARDMIGEVERSLVDVATAFLGTQILGDPKSDDAFVRAGLRLDDALALEARYYAIWTDHPGVAPETGLAGLAPLSPSKLWEEDGVRRYALTKLRTGLGKAEPLTRFSPETKSTLKHADMLFVGLHQDLGRGPLGGLLDEATHGKSGDVIDDWPDPDRVVFYHSILGVPLYCFPHLNQDMKHAYRRFQAQRDKAWPLHVDPAWETLPDLDPTEARQERTAREARAKVGVAALALAIAREAIQEHDGTFTLALEGGGTVDLGQGALAASVALLGLEQAKPTLYDLVVAPLVADARAASESADTRDALDATAKHWAETCVKLELLSSRDAAQERRYRDLREARTLLQQVLPG